MILYKSILNTKLQCSIKNNQELEFTFNLPLLILKPFVFLSNYSSPPVYNPTTPKESAVGCLF